MKRKEQSTWLKGFFNLINKIKNIFMKNSDVKLLDSNEKIEGNLDKNDICKLQKEFEALNNEYKDLINIYKVKQEELKCIEIKELKISLGIYEWEYELLIKLKEKKRKEFKRVTNN